MQEMPQGRSRHLRRHALMAITRLHTHRGKTMNAIEKFFREEDGVTALEYGLLAAVVAGALIVVAGPALRTFFTDIFTEISLIASRAFSGA